MATRLSMVLTLGLPLLVACDPVVGVQREAVVRSMPAVDEVRTVLRRVPGVDSVRPYHDGGDTTATETLGFLYYGPQVRGELMFRRDSLRVRYEQTNMRIGDRMPRTEVEATLRVMREIEARLDSLPELSGFRSVVSQQCERIVCS